MEEFDLDGLFREKMSKGEAPVPEGSWKSVSSKIAQEQSAKTKNRILPLPLLWLAASFIIGSITGAAILHVSNQTLDRENILAERQEIRPETGDFIKRNGTENEKETITYSANPLAISFATEGSQKIRQQFDFEGTAPVSFKNSVTMENKRGQPTRRKVSETDMARRKRDRRAEFTEIHPEVTKGKASEKPEFNDTVGNIPDSFLNAAPGYSLNSLAGIDSARNLRDTVYLTVSDTSSARKKIRKKVKLLGFPISAGFYLAPEMSGKSIHFSNSPDPAMEQYKKEDVRKFGFSGGITLDFHLPKNFYLRTGLSYWNFGEKNTVYLTHKDSDTTVTTSKEDDKSIIRPDTAGFTGIDGPGTPGLETTISKLTEVRESLSQFSSTVSNNYHYIGIPVILGTDFSRNKLRFGAWTGIITNFLISPSTSVSYVYHDPASPEKFVQEKRDLAKVNFVFNAGMDISYSIAKDITLAVSPNIKYSLTSVYKDRNTIQQLPYSFGLQFGLRYKL